MIQWCTQYYWNVSERHGIQISPVFQKYALGHFTVMTDLPSYLFSLTDVSPKRIFAFRKKWLPY